MRSRGQAGVNKLPPLVASWQYVQVAVIMLCQAHPAVSLPSADGWSMGALKRLLNFREMPQQSLVSRCAGPILRQTCGFSPATTWSARRQRCHMLLPCFFPEMPHGSCRSLSALAERMRSSLPLFNSCRFAILALARQPRYDFPVFSCRN